MSCSTPPTLTQPTRPRTIRPPLPFSHVILGTMEHILIHRIDKKHWAALNHEKMLVPIAEKEFQVLEDTEAVRFCIVNTLGLRQVHLLDMARQVYEYG